MKRYRAFIIELLFAPVAQRIEHWFPKPCAWVRVPPGVPPFCDFPKVYDHQGYQVKRLNSLPLDSRA